MTGKRTQLLTRFSTVDAAAAADMAELLRATASTVASEDGHLSYAVFGVDGDPSTMYVFEEWASPRDAQHHADMALGGGGLERVLPLLREPLDTRTLVPIATSAPVGVPEGEAA